MISQRFISYVFVGGLATVVDWGSFFVMNHIMAWNYIPAVCISFLLGAVTNYSLNRIFTFKNKYKDVLRQYLVHLMVTIVSLGLTITIMYLLIQKAGLNGLTARVMTSGFMLIVNYLMHKNITYGVFK